MKEKLKLYLIQILKIALGVYLVYYFVNNDSVKQSGILIIFLLLLISYLFYITILLFNGGEKEDWKKPFRIWEAVVMLTGFIIGMLEIGYSYYTVLNFSSLFWQSILAGAAFGIIIQIIRSKTGNNNESWTKTAGRLIGYALFGFVVASVINKSYANEQKETIRVTALEKSEKKSDKDIQYFVKIKLPEEEKLIKISKEKWDKINPGSELILIMQKGLLGYDMIEDVKVKQFL